MSQLAAAGLVIFGAGCVIPHSMSRVAPAPACLTGEGTAAAELLTWYRPSVQRDARLNEAWCGTVGLPIVQTTQGGPDSSWRPGDSLVIVAWNINVGGGDLVAFLNDELGYTCTPSGVSASSGVSARRSSPFVLLLQEVHRRSDDLPIVDAGPLIPWHIDPDPRPGELGIDDAARRCGLALLYVPSARNGPDQVGRPPEDKGNAILSTLPLSDPLAIELPFEAGRKVAVGASVDTPHGERLRVVSVHLDVASTLYRTLITGNGTRVRQVSGLKEALDEGRATATLVGGDFNTWTPREAALNYMRVHFPESPPWDGRGTRGPLPTDHIFFGASDDAGVEVVPESYTYVEDTYYSDHEARLIRIRSTPRGNSHRGG